MNVAPRYRARGLLSLAVATSAVWALAGCSADDAPQPVSGPCITESTLSDARSIDLVPVTIAVTNPGTGDLRVPTPAPATDAPQAITLNTESTEDSVTAGQVQNTAETLTTPLTVRADCKNPSAAEFTVARPTSPDTALDPELESVTDTRGGLSFGDGGAPTTLKLAPREGATAPASRALEQSLVSALNYTVPLPTTPIGTGAVWTATRTLSAATTVTQTMTVTVKSWEGDQLVLDIAIDEDPIEPTFRIPGSNDVLNLNRFSNTGSGTVTIDLKAALPVDGTLTMSGARELVGNDANNPLLQKTGLKIVWSTPK